MSLFEPEVRHSPLCRECIDRPIDHLLIGEDGRSFLPAGPDCPCIASYATACLLCQTETASPQNTDGEEADDSEDEDHDEDEDQLWSDWRPG